MNPATKSYIEEGRYSDPNWARTAIGLLHAELGAIHLECARLCDELALMVRYGNPDE